ncbi:MAG: rhodanese-like domain-containing protein [Fimbriimonas sp.]
MILKNFYDSQLAHASYLVGCARSGEAIVIDPNRNLEPYLAAAEAEGLKIVAVTETHIHADYVSGARELAGRTGATLYLSDEGTSDWKYAFADEPNVRLVRDGDAIRVGNLRLEVVATPGHTPEHIAFVLTDEAATSIPYGAFTGDFIFIGDVGRPDLLERAAGFAGTMEAGARTLYGSLQRFRRYPETMLLWPAHGSGSPCGKSLGGVPTSSYGYELATNWGLRTSSEAAFVEEVLAGQPEPPAYFKEMKRINKRGPEPFGDRHAPDRIAGERALQAAKSSLVLDLRPRHQSSAGTLPGAINIPLDKGFVIRAGSVLPFGEPLYLLAVNEAHATTAMRMLGQIGFDSVLGWFGPEVLQEYGKHAEMQILPSVSGSELRSAPEHVQIIDVRGQAEVAAGRIEGSHHIPLGDLSRRASELNRDLPVVVHCASGARSAVAGTILKRLGFRDVSNLEGGYDAYMKALGDEGHSVL